MLTEAQVFEYCERVVSTLNVERNGESIFYCPGSRCFLVSRPVAIAGIRVRCQRSTGSQANKKSRSDLDSFASNREDIFIAA
jgi:hypothetical protein